MLGSLRALYHVAETILQVMVPGLLKDDLQKQEGTMPASIL